MRKWMIAAGIAVAGIIGIVLACMMAAEDEIVVEFDDTDDAAEYMI